MFFPSTSTELLQSYCVELGQILGGTANTARRGGGERENRQTPSSPPSFDRRERLTSRNLSGKSEKHGPSRGTGRERAYRGDDGEEEEGERAGDRTARRRICRLDAAVVAVARGRQGERGNFPRREGGKVLCNSNLKFHRYLLQGRAAAGGEDWLWVGERVAQPRLFEATQPAPRLKCEGGSVSCRPRSISAGVAIVVGGGGKRQRRLAHFKMWNGVVVAVTLIGCCCCEEDENDDIENSPLIPIHRSASRRGHKKVD